MGKTKAGEVVNITYYHKGDYDHAEVKLADKYDYYKKLYPDPKYEDQLQEFQGVGFLGVSTKSLRVDIIETQARPFKDADSLYEVLGRGFLYVAFPIFGMSPMPKEYTDLIVINGPLGAMPANVFWILANLFYWLFWLNFMVGATNALPALPLDGGHLLRDGLKKMFKRMFPRWVKDKVEKTANRITYASSFSVLFLIIWLIIGSYVAAFFRTLIG
jgi:membrane-associated protease RseP (regulator of RpoE activity)